MKRFSVATVIAILLAGSGAWADVTLDANQAIVDASAPAVVAVVTPPTATVPTPIAPEETSEAVTLPSTSSGQAWWQAILVTVIEATAAIMVPILSILIGFLLKKWNLKLEQEKVDWILNKAIGAGEQYAYLKLKKGEPVEGPEIFKVAHAQGTKLLEQYGLAAKLGSFLGDLIEAKLGQDNRAARPAPEAV